MKNLYFVILSSLALSACGSLSEPEPCTTQEVEGGVIIVCPDGSVTQVNHGENGQDGQDGESPDPDEQASCTVEQMEDGAMVTCPDGTEAFVESPPDPEPCTVEPVEGGAMISCPDGSETFVEGGIQGEQGEAPEVTTEEVEPGAECTNGGTRILVDGVPTGDPICNGNGYPECDVYNGTANSVFTVHNVQDMVPLAGCRVLVGSLQINYVEDLSLLSALEEVTMNVAINHTNLTDLTGLDNLKTVGRNIEISSNDYMTSLTGFSPTSVAAEESYVNINIRQNSILSNCVAENWVSNLTFPPTVTSVNIDTENGNYCP